jgi:serine/threonine protein kinase
MIGENIGQYRIVSKLGEGGMGIVYQARDEVLHRDVAVKVLTPGVLDQLGKDHLLREAQTASALSHPNVCTIHQIGSDSSGFYVVMELIDGRPLNALAGQLTTETVIRYGVQIADALAHAHDRGIVHRDLKGANILITPDGRVKVLDFGLARRMEKTDIDAVTRSYASLVQDQAISGTLPYMAPEVLKGETGSFSCDIWGLGVVLYEAASGKLPFHGETGYALTAGILHEPPTELPITVPAGLASIILRCLTKEPERRFQRAGEVRAALETIQAAAVIAQPSRREDFGPRTVVQRGIEHIAFKKNDVLLFLGTNKGAFLLRSRPDRKSWDVAGPYFHGQTVYAVDFDQRGGRHRLWASTGSPLWGTFLRSSDDFGKTWTNPVRADIRFPPESGLSLKNVWKICPGPPHEPDTLYCGVEPAALFESRDAGDSWSLNRGLFDHPHRPRWMPGQGGLCLHTILPHPSNPLRMHVGISAAGVYRTDDGGRTWSPRNQGIRVTFLPDRYPEFGQCVHKIVRHSERPDRLFLQNHWGLYRSDDGADSWQDIAHGVPSDFGFAMAVHPHDPDCVYIVPMESDEFRCTPQGRLRVYRSLDAGGSWQALTRGLPQQGAYETVLREGMTTDSLEPAGIYFGTRSGKLYGSRDDGKTWKRLVDGLPQIVCVAAALVTELVATPRLKPARITKAEPKSSKRIPANGKESSKGTHPTRRKPR